MSNTNSTTVGGWDAELVALRDAIYAEQRAIRGDFTLQDAAKCAIAQLAAQRAEAAAQRAAEPAADLSTPAGRKAAYNASQGVRAVRSAGGYLVPSATRNVVHFVADSGVCSCEAGQSGKSCWHVALVDQQDRQVAA